MACASITSEPTPQAGQKHRSSDNFSTGGCGSVSIRWSAPGGITFDVMKDVSGGTDPVIHAGLTNGSITSNDQARSLYIANPRNATGDFLVTVSPA
jgi:hypothetical protein